RFIKVDDEVVKQVSQDVLRSEGNGNTPDAKTGDDRTDILVEVLQQEDDTDDPDENVDHKHQPAELFHFLLGVFFAADARAEPLHDRCGDQPYHVIGDNHGAGYID